jgi:TrmH family RNA methyltransferase
MLETITSIKDEKIAFARAIKSRKGRQEHQRILLEGEEILDWAIENAICIEYIFLSNKSFPEIADKYLSRNLKVFKVTEGILKKVTDTNYVIPVIGVAKTSSDGFDFKAPFAVVLDSVQDFGNIGTIIRTCQAFGIKNIISTMSNFDIYQRKTIEASRGSVFATHLARFENEIETIKYLRNQGYQIVATSPKGSDLQSLIELRQQPVALVIGNETTGISSRFEEQADFLIQIPMSLAVESLNVGVAAGISIYELRLKQVLAMIEQQIKSTLGRELSVAGTLVQQVLDTELRKVSDLSSQQVIFMMVLKCDRKMLLQDMCRQFGILEKDAETFLRPMLKAGLVAMNGELELTNKGEEVLAKLWFTVENAEGRILSSFTTEEVNVLKTQLHRVQEKCSQIIKGN